MKNNVFTLRFGIEVSHAKPKNQLNFFVVDIVT